PPPTSSSTPTRAAAPSRTAGPSQRCTSPKRRTAPPPTREVNGPLKAFVVPPPRGPHALPLPARPGLAPGAAGAGRETAAVRTGGGALLGTAGRLRAAQPLRPDPGAGGKRGRAADRGGRDPRHPRTPRRGLSAAAADRARPGRAGGD